MHFYFSVRHFHFNGQLWVRGQNVNRHAVFKRSQGQGQGQEGLIVDNLENAFSEMESAQMEEQLKSRQNQDYLLTPYEK